MTIAIARRVTHASLALIALSSVSGLQSAYAAGTDAGTAINNRATVNYSVGGVAQTAIESSSTGNSTPGAGAGSDTTFVVDNRIIHTVTELSNAATTTTPGAVNVATTFTVRNDGNFAQGYQLSAANTATAPSYGGGADNSDVTVVRVFHDANGNGVFDGGDTENYINTLAEDASATVVVLANVPVTASNGQYANVQLAARAAQAGTNGATLMTQTGGADDPAVVDVVFADAGATARDGFHEDEDQYAVQSASLTVTKTSAVVSDPFNGAVNPKAIPGAVVRYTVTVANASATTAADGVSLEDVIPTNTVYVPGSLTLNAAALTDASDADAGRFEAAPTPRIIVDAGTIATGGGSATVTFQVTVQ